MVNSSTSRFGFHESESSKIYYYFRMEKINGAYYVGFDYSAEGQNPNQQVDRDYIYNDWIVKIVPGKGQEGITNVGGGETTDTETITKAKYERKKLMLQGRVFCEDLAKATRADIDFNDIVFDAFIYKDGSIDIEVKARGGTLPVSVAGIPITMKQMSNTGVNTDEFQLINISAEEANAKGWREIVDIPIVVQTSQAGEVISFELTAQVGKVPQKICTHIGVHWPKEYARIDKGYPNFRNYVAAWHTDWTSETFEEYLFNDIY